jgi:DNA-binding NarL/FixJ family response regulator
LACFTFVSEVFAICCRRNILRYDCLPTGRSKISTDPERILIVDDDMGFRASVAALLGRVGFVTSEAATGEEAMASARHRRPACVLLDVLLPGLTGYEVCHELRSEYGEILPIVFVSGERIEAVDRVAGMLVGADDYVVKPFDSAELVVRVRRLVARSIAGRSSANGDAAFALTKREREVLRLLALGLDQDAIARKLVLSPKTVATHIQHVLPKLGVRSRTQAVALAYREGLVADGDGARGPGERRRAHGAGND